MPILIVEKGPERGRTVELQAACRWIFGRDESCDFTTEDISCSRRHFGIAEKDGRYILKDLKSTHGTSVNGTAVEMKELGDGDTVVAGETVFSFALDKSSGRGLVGKTIAGYQIFERIGRGGMGTVFRAKQVALDRDVALKVLSAKYSDDKTFINRFFKEAQAAARLNNPNVVQVFDVREEKGLYLISLEMMDGGTVQELATKEGQLPISRVLRIAREAAKGLAYAEKKHIVHGDIKPDNLMMNADGHIKISDLGLARDIGEMAHQGEEGVFGTPHFISPEQAQGKAVDSRSDIYSLGATIYRLIAGTTPFTGSSVREIIMKQINDEPTALSEHRADCPTDLADLVSVMMAKDPEDRFESAEALQAAIESLGETGTLGSGQSSRKVALIGGLLVVVLAVVGYVMSQKEDPSPVNPNPPTTNNGEKQPTAEEIALREKQEKQNRENEVKGLRANAELFLAELVSTGKNEDIPSLQELLKRFEKAKQAGPDTDEAAIVQGKIDALKTQITNLEEATANAAAAAAAKREADDKAFDALKKAIEEHVANRRFSAALATLSESGLPLKKSHRAAELSSLKLIVLDGARRAFKSLENDITTKVNAADFPKARELAGAFRDHLLEGTTADAIDKDLASYLALVTAQEKKIDDRESAKRDADRKLDQSTVYSILHPYYTTFATNFDLDRKKTLIQSVSASLQTPHFRPRVDRIMASIEASIALRTALIEQVKSEAGSVSTYSGHRELPAGKIIEVTDDALVIEKRSGKKETLSLKSLSAEVLYDALFRKFAATPAQRLDLAVWLIECCRFEDANEVLSELDETLQDAEGALKDRFADVKKDLAEELAATTLLAEIRALHKEAATATTSGHWMRIKGRLELFVRKYRGTRTYLINSDGSSPLE